MGPGFIASFRHLFLSKSSYFVSLAKRYVSPLLHGEGRLVITIAPVIPWLRGELRYEHIVRTISLSGGKGSVKLTIPVEVVRALGMCRNDIVWIRAMPATENPPPPEPVISLPEKKVQWDRSSYFVLLSLNHIELLTGITTGTLTIPSTLHVEVWKKNGEHAVLGERRPIILRDYRRKREAMVKITVPRSLLNIRKGERIWVVVRVKR